MENAIHEINTSCPMTVYTFSHSSSFFSTVRTVESGKVLFSACIHVQWTRGLSLVNFGCLSYIDNCHHNHAHASLDNPSSTGLTCPSILMKTLPTMSCISVYPDQPGQSRDIQPSPTTVSEYPRTPRIPRPTRTIPGHPTFPNHCV